MGLVGSLDGGLTKPPGDVVPAAFFAGAAFGAVTGAFAVVVGLVDVVDFVAGFVRVGSVLVVLFAASPVAFPAAGCLAGDGRDVGACAVAFGVVGVFTDFAD
jgi:hypothetical protein